MYTWSKLFVFFVYHSELFYLLSVYWVTEIYGEILILFHIFVLVSIDIHIFNRQTNYPIIQFV